MPVLGPQHACTSMQPAPAHHCIAPDLLIQAEQHCQPESERGQATIPLVDGLHSTYQVRRLVGSPLQQLPSHLTQRPGLAALVAVPTSGKLLYPHRVRRM